MSSNKIEISDNTIVRSILWIIFFFALFYFKSIVLVLFLSVVMASVVNRFASVLKKIKIPRYISIVSFYLIFLGFIFFVVYNFFPASLKYIGTSISSLPALLDSFKTFSPSSSAWYSNFLSYLVDYAKAIDPNLLSEKIKSWLFNTSIANSTSIVTIVSDFFMMLIISFYISFSETGIQNFIRLISPKKYEDYMISLFARVERKISSWFLGQILVAFIIALCIYIMLLLFRIPFALPISFLAFIFEIFPILGTAVSSIPALFFAWNMGGITLAFLVFISFLLISQISSHFLYPKIVGKFVGIPTVVIIIAVFIGFEMGGFWGALIAIPVASIIVEILEDIKALKD